MHGLACFITRTDYVPRTSVSNNSSTSVSISKGYTDTDMNVRMYLQVQIVAVCLLFIHICLTLQEQMPTSAPVMYVVCIIHPPFSICT